ncbi:efflux RND transporter periplasmic adaptor subunit [Carboxylicivirga sp. M1479]|uniref:efflux RND transporter periplasmic adaptor subunit n=1 Tax=Carboxylicivirga sp. M1479 TaxID=2594476 RepID=UPI001177F3BA|nr:efflux RND transporter periplasmic adaptor subunit [Carboxylicivirga sp. M1479]TRX72659.1 efflux RND transporter periplasmic adaptor subunit [Carboxylicivirga sp. M1479]
MDKQIKKQPWWKKNLRWLIAAFVFVCWCIYFIAFADHRSQVKVNSNRLTISKVNQDIFQDYISVTATVEPIKTIYLDAIEGGRVESILLEEGNMVQAGDAIAHLSNTNLILEISNNEANVARAINELRTARLQMEMNAMELQNQIVQLEGNLFIQKRKFDNSATFYKEGLVSEDEYLQDKTNYEASYRQMNLLKESFKRDSVYRGIQIETLENSAMRMEENQGIIRKRLDHLTIKAPVDGQLASLNLEEGQVINYGTRVGKVNILDRFKLKAQVDEHYITRIKPGLNANCQFSSSTIEASIKKIYAEVIDGKFAVDLVFSKDTVPDLRIGQTSHVKLQLGNSMPALLLPRGSFFQSTGGQWVFVLNKEGTAAYKRHISIGRQNPKYFEVLDGLQAGEEVITSGYEIFGDNEVVLLK